METGLSPGTRPSPPSSVLSPIGPWSYESIRNTSFSFSAPFPTRSQKSLTWTKPSADSSVKSNISNSPMLGDSGILKPATSRTTAQVTKLVPAKRKNLGDRANDPARSVGSGTVEPAIAAHQSAVSATSARSAEETTQARSV